MSNDITPFESIRRINPAGNEFWSSRDFAKVLGYNDYRNFEAVVQKARTACFNSGQRVEDHFVEVTDMIEIGKGGQRPVQTVMMSRYACYLVIQNADPAKEIVAQGQTYFAIQTRRQELSDEEIEAQRRLAIRSELRTHNSQLADAAKDAGNAVEAAAVRHRVGMRTEHEGAERRVPAAAQRHAGTGAAARARCARWQSCAGRRHHRLLRQHRS